MNEIIATLAEKGYESAKQLSAYALISNPSYITRYNGAKEKIKEIDIAFIKEYLEGEV